MINIKHEIFEDDIEELKVIDVQTFEREYSQIYGLFTVTVDEHDFIPYPPDDIPLSAKKLYSELILTQIPVLKNQFKNEVRNKTKLFVEEIKTINPNLLQSKCFKHITR